MSDNVKRGDHEYVDTNCYTEIHESVHLEKSVYDAEIAAVDKRREFVNERIGRDRRKSVWTGLALSGGGRSASFGIGRGMRSASFGLGVLQALHEHTGIEGIDYLSTVSGGAFIGGSLTAALQKTGGEFPFTQPTSYADSDSVRHIKGYRNYFAPGGVLDFGTALAFGARASIANILFILPILLFFIWISLTINPSQESLGKPTIFIHYLIDVFPWLPILPTLHGYWFTALLLAVYLLFLFAWALCTSMNLASSGRLKAGWVGVSKIIILATLITTFFETLSFILWARWGVYHDYYNGHDALRVTDFEGLFEGLFEDLFKRIWAIVAASGIFVVIINKYLGNVLEAAAKHATDWMAWFKRLGALAVLWYTVVFVLIFLWFIYSRLVDYGFGHELARVSYFAAFVLSTFVALLINPNKTSGLRFYRDCLSKAFLFDPDPRQRDKFGDLKPYEPKLHEIDTDLCPYPIINAALDIEGSSYATKRGRNAEFFILTPEYVGSDATGYIGTQQIEKKEPIFDLGTAMAVSGAGVSANINIGTLFTNLLNVSLALMNVRHGYWLHNPNPTYADPPKQWGRDWFLAGLFKLYSFVLLAEIFGWITEKRSKVYLTDGGNIENLGIYSLLKRRCKVIIAVDTEVDPTKSFDSFVKLQRYARADLGTIIELPLDGIRVLSKEVDKAFKQAGVEDAATPSERGPHCAVGEIQYGPNETGILVYLVASLSGDEDTYVLDYKRRHPAFPHETTSDLVFSEEQFEVYRALGFHIMKGILTGEAPFVLTPRKSEWEYQARERVLDSIRAALLGVPRASLTTNI